MTMAGIVACSKALETEESMAMGINTARIQARTRGQEQKNELISAFLTIANAMDEATPEENLVPRRNVAIEERGFGSWFIYYAPNPEFASAMVSWSKVWRKGEWRVAYEFEFGDRPVSTWAFDPAKRVIFQTDFPWLESRVFAVPAIKEAN